MKKILPILFTFCFVFCFSQERRISFEEKQKIKEDSIVQSIQSKLKEKGVEEYFYFKNIRGQANIIDIQEDDSSSLYFLENFDYCFFYTKDNNHFIKRFHRNRTNFKIIVYEELLLQNDYLFKFLDKNIKRITTEKVKRYEVLNEKKEKGILVISSSSEVTLFLKKNKKAIENQFIGFDITTNSVDWNLNYEYNQSLKIVQLYNKCEKIISELEEKNLFVEEK